MGQRDGFSKLDLQKINSMYCRNRPGYGNGNGNNNKPAPIPASKPEENQFLSFVGAIFNKLVFGDEWEVAVNKTISEMGEVQLDIN